MGCNGDLMEFNSDLRCDFVGFNGILPGNQTWQEKMPWGGRFIAGKNHL